jgi:hypothetical protein
VNPKPAITRTRIYWRQLEGTTEPINGHGLDGVQALLRNELDEPAASAAGAKALAAAG